MWDTRVHSVYGILSIEGTGNRKWRHSSVMGERERAKCLLVYSPNGTHPPLCAVEERRREIIRVAAR